LLTQQTVNVAYDRAIDGRGLPAGLCYGGDYNPEQWPESVWQEDMALMRTAGVNLVTVGVFAWSSLQPRPDVFELDWLARVLDLLHAHGIGAVLATPTASPPPWFSRLHPDALPMTADGVRLIHGSRDTYCPSAPAYLAAARTICATLVARFRDHPALAMWHVHNEYGAVCHCPHSTAAFRTWLRDRYRTLDALNDAWTTAFWGQGYGDWDEIETPRATRYLANPGQDLDFRRFCSDALLAAYVQQRDLIRAATPDVPVTTNFVFGPWVPVDHARWAKEVDIVAIDDYPSEAGPGADDQTAFAGDLARGWARGRPWLLMESAPNLIHTPGRMHAKEPGRLAVHSLAHVARGSRGVMFFQWRQPRGGAERFHSAVVTHAGADTRVFREVVALGERLRTTVPAVPRHPTAIVFDAHSWWALQGPGLPTAVDYLAEVRAAHKALGAADVVFPGEPVDAYRTVVVPALFLLDDAYAEVLRRHVLRGGTLVVSYLSGVCDAYARVRLGGYPGALRDVLGIRVEEFQPLAAPVELGFPAAAVPETGMFWSERIHLRGAVAEATYLGGSWKGLPAITRHGRAWYLSTRLGPEAYARTMAHIVNTER